MNATPDIAITVKDLTIGYGEKVILRNVNFQVRRGEVFVILGASGSGKSTLLKAMIGLNVGGGLKVAEKRRFENPGAVKQ